MRAVAKLVLPTLAFAVAAAEAFGCSFAIFESPPTLAQRQANTNPVVALLDCSFTGAGTSDLSAGPAIDLGSGRVYQQRPIYRYEREGVEVQTGGAVLVVDCNERTAVMLHGRVLDRSCGIQAEAIAIEGSISDLTEGQNLAKLEAFVVSMGGASESAIDYFNRTYDHDGQFNIPNLPDDSVDLLCGCTVFYPDSPGATQ